MTINRRAVAAARLVLPVSLAVALGACGGGSASGTGSSDAASVSAGASATAPVADACTLLTEPQVSAVLNRIAAGTGESKASEGYGLSYCVWGLLTDGTALSLQVFSPGAVGDPLGLLLAGVPGVPHRCRACPTVRCTPPARCQATGAWVRRSPGRMPGRQVALSVVGAETPESQQQALVAAAREVNSALG